MIAFTTWLWGTKYRESHVLKLAAGVARNYDKPYRFVVFADRNLDLPAPLEVKPIANLQLTGRGCFCRLRMFDPAWQGWNGFNDRIVNLDLDVLPVRSIDSERLFERPETFMILQGVNAANPCPFNCSVMMLKAGAHAEVWRDFSMERAQATPFYEFPDDQGWLWHKLPNAAGWKSKESGIYAFQKPGWPGGNSLPDNARIVAFFGWRKPEAFAGLDWVAANWKI